MLLHFYSNLWLFDAIFLFPNVENVIKCLSFLFILAQVIIRNPDETTPPPTGKKNNIRMGFFEAEITLNYHKIKKNWKLK